MENYADNSKNVNGNKFFWMFLILIGFCTCYFFWKHNEIKWLYFILFFVWGVSRWLNPSAIETVCYLWNKIGNAVAQFINPLFLGVLYFCLLTPIVFVYRIFKKENSEQQSSFEMKTNYSINFLEQF